MEDQVNVMTARVPAGTPEWEWDLKAHQLIGAVIYKNLSNGWNWMNTRAYVFTPSNKVIVKEANTWDFTYDSLEA